MSKINNWFVHPAGKTDNVYTGANEVLNDKFYDSYHYYRALIHNKKLNLYTKKYIKGYFDGFMIFPYLTYKTPDSNTIGRYVDTTFNGGFGYNDGYDMLDTPGENICGRGYGHGYGEDCGDIDGSDTINYDY